MNSKLKRPSFKIWIVVLVFSLIFISPLHYYFFSPGHYIFNDFIPKKLHTFFSGNDKGKKKVVVLGNSLTHCALPYQIETAGLSFDYFRIYHGGVSLMSFMPVLENLIQYEPEYIVIQSDLFMLGIDIRERKSQILKYLLSYNDEIRNSIQIIRENSELDEQIVFRTPLKKIRLEDHVNNIIRVSKLRPEIVAAFKSFLEKIKGKDIQIILLDLPRFKEVEDSLNTNVEIMENKRFIDEISKSPQVMHLSILSNLPDSLYQDHSHFNETGRKLFTSAFSTKMDSLVRAAR